jgi:regulator of nucleoside diphosphate kinase
MEDLGENKMMKESTAAEATRLSPRITLSLGDYERLSALVKTAMISAPGLAEILAGEIARAHVLAAGKCPQDVVGMNSEVEFRDDRTGKGQSMRLVYPAESDVAKGRLSVLTPVGTALIGVRVGESITWETPAGEVRKLTVLSVKDP